jgi:dTDP-4-dehydrorhamnose reductase
MRILIVGVNGQLGQDLRDTALAAGHEVQGVDLPQVDITDPTSIAGALRRAAPQVVFNPAAMTAVDDCESKAQLAMRVNRDGAANVAAAAAAQGALMVHFSTDYVFDGTSARPYVETDPASPRTVYGRSKWEGEEAVRRVCPRHQVLRIAWLYGFHGVNFVKAILRNARRCAAAGKPLRVVDDQRGTPTWTVSVCRQALALADSGQTGTFHATCEGECSWYDFARRIVSAAGIGATVQPCTTAEFARPAPRPAYSVLENARLKALGLNTMPSWEEAFARFYALHGPALAASEETK